MKPSIDSQADCSIIHDQPHAASHSKKCAGGVCRVFSNTLAQANAGCAGEPYESERNRAHMTL